MSDVVYTSNVRIERVVGSLRLAYLPAESQPVRFGVHGAIAEHYEVNPETIAEPHAATIDYVIAGTAGWLVGTFGGALEARKIDASNGKLTADVAGEVETEDGVLIIKRIHVVYHLKASPETRDKIKRVHRIHAAHCPLYKTLHKAIEIRTEYLLEDEL